MELDELAIQVRDLGKCYQIYDRRVDRLKQAFSFGRKQYYRDFWALRDVSFEVMRGQTIGVMGRNGSGKSTLLQLVTGTLTPTTGQVSVQGRVSALLELGAGFIPDFTGRENVYVYGAIMGLTRKEIDQRFDAIAAFADIGEFIDQPVKIYSSGMAVRLAFSAAINVDPDVLIIDEVLAVGDARFQSRCMNRINQFRERGVSILFVSHDTETVKRICDHAMVLDQGRVVNRGVSVHMGNWYLALMTNDFDLEKTRRQEQDAAAKAQASDDKASAQAACDQVQAPAEPANAGALPCDAPRVAVGCTIDRALHPEFTYFRHGDGNARIVSAGFYDSQGRHVDHFFLGQTLHYRMNVQFNADLEFHIVGMHIRDARGTDIIAINSFQERLDVPPVKAGQTLSYTFSVPIELRPGNYSISSTVAYDQRKMEWMDWADNLLIFRVVDPLPSRTIFGAYYPHATRVTWQHPTPSEPTT